VLAAYLQASPFCILPEKRIAFSVRLEFEYLTGTRCLSDNQEHQHVCTAVRLPTAMVLNVTLTQLGMRTVDR
jgi:hypothetical protein